MENETDQEVKRTAEDLQTVILTLGQLPVTKIASVSRKVADSTQTTRPGDSDGPMTIDKWAEYLFSGDVPLRSGCIRELTKSLKGNVLDRKYFDDLEKSCLQCLKVQTEPFLFLSAVEGLAMIALAKKELFDKLVEVLKREALRNPPLALQVGEVLSRTCKALGDMAPVYASSLIPILLSTASNSNVDYLIVASSISTAGDLLPLCGFLLHDIQHEVGSAIIGFLSPSNHEDVRLAACGLSRQIFDQLGCKFSTATEGIVLLIYRKLKSTIMDPLISQRIHNAASLALDSIDGAVKEYLTPSTQMQNRIRILD